MNLKKITKNTLSFLPLLLISISGYAQINFKLTGKIGAMNNGKKIVLSYKKDGTYVDDTTVVNNGSFSFKGVITDPVYAKLAIDPPEILTMQNARLVDRRDFYIDTEKIQLSGENGVKTAVIKGGKAQDDFERRARLFAPVQASADSLDKLIAIYTEQKNADELKDLREKLSKELSKTAAIDSNFIKDNPNSFLSLDIWRSKHRGTMRLNFEPEFKKFSPAVRNSQLGKEIEAKFALSRSLAPGNIAPDFTLPDTLNNKISLSSLRGKNVFLCFFTTDFINYDQFAFNLGRIHRALKDKNLVMLTVYYDFNDSSLDYWKQAILKSKFNWLNLSDIGGVDAMKGAVSDTAKAYGLALNTMPVGYLIGPDGRILSSQIRLNNVDLAQDLQKLLK